MTDAAIEDLYRRYIDVLNRQDWAALGGFVGAKVTYNGEAIGLAGYEDMLRDDYRAIPDLRFTIEMLVCRSPVVAARLRFDCSPTASFLGLAIGGRRISFAENVFYEFGDGKIEAVSSIVDKAAIEKQLGG